MQEKILKFTSKIEQIKDTIMGNVSVTSILINSNNIYSGKMREIVKSFNGHLKVDYLLSAELRDENNGNYHILGGRKLEDHVCKQIIEFVKKQALEYLLGQRIFGPNGEIDIILITNDTSASLEEKLLQHLIYCDNYNLYTGKKHR